MRKLIAGIPLVLGVTFISFLLMVYFGPDKTYALLDRNPTPEQIEEMRQELGYDKPFLTRYVLYAEEIVTLNPSGSIIENARPPHGMSSGSVSSVPPLDLTAVATLSTD